MPSNIMDFPQKNDLVERCIEGQWFRAIVRDTDKRRLLLQLCYVDDGNIEDGVHVDETRVVTSHRDGERVGKMLGEEKKSENEDAKEGETKLNGDYAENTPPSCVKRDDTLPKPLAGLIEDDSEVRYKHVPTVTIHQTLDTEEAIIINGSESKLAAGGGLRALRYLKN